MATLPSSSMTATAVRQLTFPLRSRSSSSFRPVFLRTTPAANRSLHLQRQCSSAPRRAATHSPAATTALSPEPFRWRRSYHSHDHPDVPPAEDRFSEAEKAILSASYKHITESGFTERTLALGAHDAGYPDISTAILPDGVFSLVRWHLVTQRQSLAARNKEIFGTLSEPGSTTGPTEPTPADVLERAERLLWERLLANRDVVGRWQEALAIMAQPSYVPASLRELALLSDEIWALAGDTSVDPSWYTKRAALSAIYASSELFMTTDPDPDFAATREFLHRRFHESQELGGYVRSIGQWVGFAASAGLNVLRSKGAAI